MLTVVMLNVVILGVIMLSVMAPFLSPLFWACDVKEIKFQLQ